MADCEPNLGCATTREMLREVQVRAKLFSSLMLDKDIQEWIAILSDDFLNYRTIDS